MSEEIEVPERIAVFTARYPEGSGVYRTIRLSTENPQICFIRSEVLLSHDSRMPGSDELVVLERAGRPVDWGQVSGWIEGEWVWRVVDNDGV